MRRLQEKQDLERLIRKRQEIEKQRLKLEKTIAEEENQRQNKSMQEMYNDDSSENNNNIIHGVVNNAPPPQSAEESVYKPVKSEHFDDDFISEPEFDYNKGDNQIIQDVLAGGFDSMPASPHDADGEELGRGLSRTRSSQYLAGDSQPELKSLKDSTTDLHEEIKEE